MDSDGPQARFSNPATGRKTFYHGWANLAIAALAMVGTLPGRTQGLGLITEPLLVDLRFDRVTYATINLWATLIGAAFCVPCGRLTDRFGSRIVLTAIALALGFTVLGMSWATGAITLCLAITLTRGLGQSALSVVSLALVGKWFARRLNSAMAVYSSLIGIGFIAAFPAVGHMVVTAGWRPAWSAVGWVLVLVLAPLAWLVLLPLTPAVLGLLRFVGERRQRVRLTPHALAFLLLFYVSLGAQAFAADLVILAAPVSGLSAFRAEVFVPQDAPIYDPSQASSAHPG